MFSHIPFPKKGKSEVVKMLNEGMRPELTETDLSKELNGLIELCWSQDPNQRISFDQVIFKMVEKKKGRFTSERIESFYEKCQVKSDYTLRCLNAFDTIKNYIGQTFQYRFEFWAVISTNWKSPNTR